MQYLLALIIAIVVATPMKVQAKKVDCQKHPIYCQIKKNKPKMNNRRAYRLSNLIHQASRKYKIPARIYTAILMQESGYRVGTIHSNCGVEPSFDIDLKSMDYTVACVWQDFGMSQINYKTAKQYNMNIWFLLTQADYSIDAGAKVLSWFKRRYEKRNPKFWFVRYNCGTRSSIDRPTCNAYKKLVKRWM